jgi:hypothetical protein
MPCHSLAQQVWEGAQEFPFLMSTQVVQMLLRDHTWRTTAVQYSICPHQISSVKQQCWLILVDGGQYPSGDRGPRDTETGPGIPNRYIHCKKKSCVRFFFQSTSCLCLSNPKGILAQFRPLSFFSLRSL